MSDDLMDFDDESETTAVVTLADIRRQKSKQQTQPEYHILVHVKGTELGRVRTLEQDTILLGRGSDADIWLADDGVSRRHARLVKSGNSYSLIDLGSANGSFVQGERIESRVLKDGDQVQLGPGAIFRYSLTDTNQKAVLEKLYSTSVTDALTGARNREYLDTLLTTELSFAKRHQADLSFILFDLDHFKRVNDTYGHPAGDQVLVEVAQAVQKELRAEDVLCRYGGEEFAIVLRQIPLNGAVCSAERIRQRIESLTIVHDKRELKVTASLGVSTLNEISEVSSTALMALADQRLYTAKSNGRNQVISR